MRKDNESGMISLEACIVVPIFIFLVMFMYGFIVMFMGDSLMAHSLIQSSKSLSLDSYATNMFDSGEETSNGEFIVEIYAGALSFGDEDFASTEKWYEDEDMLLEEVERRFLGFLCGGDTAKADELLEYVGVEDGLDGLDFSGSKIDGDDLIINVKYNQEFIYDFQGLASFERERTVRVKMW